MPSLTYIESDGTPHQIEANIGNSVMSLALDNLVPGIDADCGGGCSCGTCHVYVDPEWLDRVGVAGSVEEAMLATVRGRQRNSRLSCRIIITADMDGLVVRTPRSQR